MISNDKVTSLTEASKSHDTVKGCSFDVDNSDKDRRGGRGRSSEGKNDGDVRSQINGSDQSRCSVNVMAA